MIFNLMPNYRLGKERKIYAGNRFHNTNTLRIEKQIGCSCLLEPHIMKMLLFREISIEELNRLIYEIDFFMSEGILTTLLIFETFRVYRLIDRNMFSSL